MKVVMAKTILEKIAEVRRKSIRDDKKIDHIVLTRDEAREFVSHARHFSVRPVITDVDCMFIHSKEQPLYIGIPLYLEGHTPEEF